MSPTTRSEVTLTLCSYCHIQSVIFLLYVNINVVLTTSNNSVTITGTTKDKNRSADRCTIRVIPFAGSEGTPSTKSQVYCIPKLVNKGLGECWAQR